MLFFIFKTLLSNGEPDPRDPDSCCIEQHASHFYIESF